MVNEAASLKFRDERKLFLVSSKFSQTLRHRNINAIIYFADTYLSVPQFVLVMVYVQ